MTDLPDSTNRVLAAAEILGLAIEIRVMPASTRTAEEAAAACDCAVGQIVKSLIFRGRTTGTPFLLLVSGDNRVDEKGVAAAIGEALKRTDAADVRELTSYAIGGVPPFGHATVLATFFDRDLLAHDVVWAAAGNPNAVFSVAPAALAKAVGAHVIDVK